jgi:cardiolipin synthase A/B
LRMIDDAERSIVLASPSLLGDDIERALLAAAARDVEISILAPARHNRAIFRVWVAQTFRRLAHPNITIHRFEGFGGMTHAKLLVVDDSRATFGSFNFFELEETTQKELNVFTTDRALISSLRTYFDAAVATSTVLAPPARSFGRFTYTLTHTLVARATRRLLRDPDWKARYA